MNNLIFFSILNVTNKKTIIMSVQKWVIFLSAILLISCNHSKFKNPHVLINTTFGEVEVELFPDKAPKTVAAFLSYVDAGFYKNSAFYRVQNNENVPREYNSGLIQGGIYTTNSKLLQTIPGLPHESTKQTHLSHISGAVSLARTTPGTASTEFFICIGDQLQFDSNESNNAEQVGYATFAKVFKGMDVVSDIQNAPSHYDAFKKDIKILNIERLQ